jgi:hypothetical protein
MSFQNRLLLNRAVVTGLRSLEVLLVAAKAGRDPHSFVDPIAEISRLVARLGGRVHRAEPAIGYLRIEVPTERLLALTASSAIDAYQISSLSRGAWYRDGPPVANAQMFRGFEVTPIAAVEPSVGRPDLPPLSPAEARGPGFTADDAGVGRWMAEHPTFDGRGVTIALIESALPSFMDPTLRTARTIDGGEVAKLAGIVNVLDPSQPDETRVRLDTIVDAPKSWARVGSRTYVLPRPGRYRQGILELPAGANVVHKFAVLEDASTREVWIDANGDASFDDETPLADVNERFDPRLLKLAHPRKADVSFVMSRGREPHVVHIYVGKGGHQSMTLSVAAGSGTDEGLASGVAPNARVLLVRASSAENRLANVFEGFIEAAQRADVDVISASAGLTLVPDTAADFAGSLFSRLVDVYRKPIMTSAANTSLVLASAHSAGTALSVGGVLSPSTYATLYGGRALEQLIVHPISSAGPTVDGAIKPDFLAPMERLAADLPWNTTIDAAPRNAPARRIPPGYQVSCCTSSTSPYAAGVAALLISGAKQSNLSVTAESLSRAMRMSARLLPGAPANEQGNGVLDINAAWMEVVHRVDPPRIVASADIVHPLAQYAARGPSGEGILEFEGWTAGTSGTRTIALRRESGPVQPVTYRVAWDAADGTFSTAASVTLPLGAAVPFPVQIAIHSPGPHSGLLTLRDAATGGVVFRTQATIVAAEAFDPATRSLAVKGTVRLMRQSAHYIQVPPGVGAIAFELEVTRGALRPTILPSHGLFPSYYAHVHPMDLHFDGKGKYQVLLPNPEPGTWTFRVDNVSMWNTAVQNPGPRDDSEAEYRLTVRLLASAIRPSASTPGGMAIETNNTGSAIAEPVLQTSSGFLRSHRGAFLRTGLPNLIELQVPRDAATLSLQLRSEQAGPNSELYLYDCTSGECFSYNIAFPAAKTHTLVVRKPGAGRWVAAVNAAPFPAAAGAFALDEIVTVGTPVQRTSSTGRTPGARWRETIDEVPATATVPGRTPVLLLELLDAAAERGEIEHPWSTRPNFVKLRDRPVALGTAIIRR